MSSGGGEVRVVFVMGASGYVASRLVKLSLQCGYTVNVTVRNPNDPKTEVLRTLDGAKERLRLFKANLLEEGSFDSAVDGCEGVFHTAFPALISTNIDPQAELIDPAVKGALSVLRSCAKVHSIKRVIVTSSITSVRYNGTPLTPDLVIDETWFSDPDVCKEFKHCYPLFKTLAEEAAWKFAKENGTDLVNIHPGLVIGPLLQPILNSSLDVVHKLIHGTPIYTSPYRIVDVRDVAYAHSRALEVPTTDGGYVLVARVTHNFEVLKILLENYSSLNLQKQ